MSNTKIFERPVAVLYQQTPPSVIDGIRKPVKPGGYRDSGADIVYCLGQQGVPVVTPIPKPNPTRDTDMVFPDVAEGIEAAISAGAKVLWANTVLFDGHPLQGAVTGIGIVGQRPDMVQKYDDKWFTNQMLRKYGLNVANEILLGGIADEYTLAVASLSHDLLASHGFRFPLVIKPIRGRGSQGVIKTDNLTQLKQEAYRLLNEEVVMDGTAYSKYGNKLILEQYLSGQEVTLTIMPPGNYHIGEKTRVIPTHWSLPPVIRFNHNDGIAPYNGVEAVVENSMIMETTACRNPAVKTLVAQCEKAGALVGAVAPIRIDCRESQDGAFYIFDLNMKPNMTGAGRPGRDNQDSLSCIAAKGIGWQYADLLINILFQAWDT